MDNRPGKPIVNSFNDRVQLSWHGFHKSPDKCSVGSRSGDCGGKSMTVRTLWFSVVFRVVPVKL